MHGAFSLEVAAKGALLAGLASALVAGASGCVSPSTEPEPPARTGPQKIYASALERRLARVRVGQSSEEVRALIGSARVRRPGSRDQSFPTPLRRRSLLTPEGRSVELELYVVGAVVAKGCPDVHAVLEPVVFVDGVVAALDWDYVETHWRSWGGTLEALRGVRNALACPFPEPEP